MNFKLTFSQDVLVQNFSWWLRLKGKRNKLQYQLKILTNKLCMNHI